MPLSVESLTTAVLVTMLAMHWYCPLVSHCSGGGPASAHPYQEYETAAQKRVQSGYFMIIMVRSACLGKSDFPVAYKRELAPVTASDL
jgi:hypothetical protein